MWRSRNRNAVAVVLGGLLGLWIGKLCLPVVSQALKCSCTVFNSVRTGDGNAGAPTLTFDSAATKGFYKFSSTAVGLSGHLVPGADATYDLGVSGTNRFRNGYFSGTVSAALAVTFPNGTYGAPSISFTNATDTGFFLVDAPSHTMGIHGALIPRGGDDLWDLGTTSGGNARFRGGYFSQDLFARSQTVGWNATPANNVKLRGNVDGNGLLGVVLGDSSDFGNVLLNKIAIGGNDVSADSTFSTTINTATGRMATTILNLRRTFSGAGTANDFVGLLSQFYPNPSSNITGAVYGGIIGIDPGSNARTYVAVEGLYAYAYLDSTGPATAMNGLVADSEFGGTNTLTFLEGVDIVQGNYGTGTVTNESGLYVQAPFNVGGGTVTNQYGLYLEDQTLAGTTLDYAIFYAAPSSKPFWVLASGELGVVQGTIAIGNGIASFVNTASTTGIRMQFAGIPTITGASFGTGNSVTAGSTDTEGEVNVGTTANTTGVLTFQTTWTSAPRCVGQISTTTAANVRTVTAVETTTQVTFGFFVGAVATAPANNALLHYQCLGTK